MSLYHNISIRTILRAVLLLLAATLAGCGSGDGLKKVVVRGTVSYDGKPIERGQILFFPLEDTRGPMSGARIHDGVYVAENKGGVPVGKHRVEIEGYKPPGGVFNPDSMEARVQYVPPKYNTKSELTLEIPDGERTIVQDYALSL